MWRCDREKLRTYTLKFCPFWTRRWWCDLAVWSGKNIPINLALESRLYGFCGPIPKVAYNWVIVPTIPQIKDYSLSLSLSRGRPCNTQLRPIDGNFWRVWLDRVSLGGSPTSIWRCFVVWWVWWHSVLLHALQPDLTQHQPSVKLKTCV